MNIALLGPSGVGKGTHAAMLSARCRLRHVATGDLFRHHVRTGSALGRLAKKYMTQGELVPDEVVDAMIDEWGDSLGPDDGALFDGFPRTTDQVAYLDGLLKRLGRELDAVVYLHASDGEIARRLSGRLICPACQTPYHAQFKPSRAAGLCDRCGATLQSRPDDTAELVRTRLRVFHRTAEPVLRHFAEAGKLIVVPGEGAVGAVEQALIGVFEAIKDRSVRFAGIEDLRVLLPVRPVATVDELLVAPALDLALLGGPGSGKGTQAERLSDALRLPHIATGDLFRENLRLGSALGQLAKSYMDRGELVPDDVTEAIVEERLARDDTRAGFILDGFPRNRSQAEALNDIMTRKRRRLAAVLYIDVSDAAIVERLSGRMICRTCQAPYHQRFNPPKQEGACDRCGGPLYTRADDVPETVRARLVTFHRQTEPLIAFYRNAGILNEITGEGGVSEIAARCLAVVQGLVGRPAKATVPTTVTPGAPADRQ